ncbi:YceI family protein [Chryseobacterium daeguense]|uniref:YceI family protein n=1 Tax=Chryseobacterium daeguense TaxID=412438 RepID=UPI00041E1B03|nr:YceI family protein [Chryseobacterium daeguense]
MDTKNFKVNNANSIIEWTGRKVTGTHNGTIAVKEGNFTFEESKLASGKFIIDTKSIKILDIEDAETNAQFAGHLASADFFNSDHFPEAIFEIIHAEPGDSNLYNVTGNLSIKGITHQTQTALQIVMTGNIAIIDSKIVVDRTKFDIKFRSGNFFTNLGDTLIYNNFDLNVHLVAQAI